MRESISYGFLLQDVAVSKLADVPFVEIQALREKLGTKKCVSCDMSKSHHSNFRFDATLRGDWKHHVPLSRRRNKHRFGVLLICMIQCVVIYIPTY